MAAKPLACTRCGSPAAVVEVVEGFLDWGLAVIDADGVVRPRDRKALNMPAVMDDNSRTVGIDAVCDNAKCGHRWRLRRRFDPLVAPGDAS
ncbi:hypothetical protein JOL79_11525 [Microbispora sp. RL4-1S]|uniref:Uncharacterized protein n=1 Tax=Microbispora oryzae TaxID=2806554 RepID=A0A941AQ83_9ACTN|nr:hypothetical protein [Microbispora oryzae]MBP2704444.1 hypothetical protein [Microbispora oryzae]